MTTELADPVDPHPAADPAADTATLAVHDAVRAAERLLTARLGAQVRLAEPEDLGGSGCATVLRVRVVRTPFTLPRTLVVKHSPVDPSGEPDLFAQEAASCQLFTALRQEDRPGPELIACDPKTRLLVLEDLGRADTVASLLHSTDSADAPRARRALLGWAHALGRLHATTRGYERDFVALLRRLSVRRLRVRQLDTLVPHTRAAVEGLPALLEAELRVSSAPTAVVEARRAEVLLDQQPYRAFSPADLGPDNAVVGQGVRFIDFEGGCFRTALLDVAQLRAPLPSSLVTLAYPPGMSQAMVAAWHAEVIGSWPDLMNGELFARRLLEAQLLWTWLCTWWLLPTPQRATAVPLCQLSLATTPERAAILVDRWEQLAAEAEEVGHSATAAHATAVAEALRLRFRIVGKALPQYPVFR